MNAVTPRSAFSYLSLFFACALTSCATTETRWAEQDSYELQVTDNLSAHRFDLHLRSQNARALCLVMEQWPSQSGQLHMGSDRAKVKTEAGNLPALDENFGYCPGGCGQYRIEPYGELRGFIAYEAFGDPLQLAADTGKQLEFSVMPFYC